MQILEVRDFGLDPKHPRAEILQQLSAIVDSVPFPVWPGYAKLPEHIGNIPALNALFAAQLKAHGWRVGHPLATGDIPDAYKEVAGARVAVEIQCANIARDEADIVKFMRLAEANQADVFVRIALAHETGALFAKGIATPEHFCRSIERLGSRYAGVPTISISMGHHGVAQEDFSGYGIAVQELKHCSSHPRLARIAESIMRKVAGGVSLVLESAPTQLGFF
ncbi:uncharacterized protein NMK_1919 [Novimethylophilus kurashikiensis]|uniref:Uncharacterized protein n=1 Tax=Novimethylophilus kurashikiensis TaxID=1825523 RepID=A0A2R5FC91_9PROT|nr:hypothetical protein [Novimethylophilus kurashikiensis]GBG14321.1 uncharacterized protein NMK_1919 [Novimethylophilus kurashikiensis]